MRTASPEPGETLTSSTDDMLQHLEQLFVGHELQLFRFDVALTGASPDTVCPLTFRLGSRASVEPD